jgi:phosphatidylglycerophosphate synthase
LVTRTPGAILRYPCTVVGYVRLALLCIALAVPPASGMGLRLLFAALVGASVLLDLLDGYLARRWGHTSNFGVLLDLGLDLITHTLVWVRSGLPLAPAIIALELAAGLYVAAVSLQPGSHWKQELARSAPALIRRYFAHHQRNLLSAYGNVAHFVLPMALYIQGGATWLTYAALPGLLLYEAVTLYMLYAMASLVLRADAAQRL